MPRVVQIALLLLLFQGCTTPPQVTITGNTSLSGQVIDHLKSNKRSSYGTFDDLKNLLGGLPPPPPEITIIPGSPGVPGVPPQTINPTVYNPLLTFLQAGPGGSVFTLTHLQQITPAAMALAQYYYANPSLSLWQLINSSQGAAFLAVAQTILQPLGMWNYNTLYQWANYISPNWWTLQGILQGLYTQLNVPLNPGAPGVPAVPDTYIVNAINPIAVITEISNLYKSKDWIRFAEFVPRLAGLLIRHAGFSAPRIVLYGSRSRFFAPGVITTRRVDGDRVVYGINQEGFFVNDEASGAGIFHQGNDDISLVYAPIKVRRGRVETLDAIASDRYMLMKGMAGGNTDLLDRVPSQNTATLAADISLDAWRFCVGAGSTPFASMGGATLGARYEGDLASGRFAVGGFVERSYSTNDENFLGYIDGEFTVRTPALRLYERTHLGPNPPIFKLWGETTVAVAGAATRTLTPVVKEYKAIPGVIGARRKVSRNWGGQGDIRIAPELRARLTTQIIQFESVLGATVGVVPYGYVDLDVPHQSLRPYPLRIHVGLTAKIRLTRAYDFAQAQAEDSDPDCIRPEPEVLYLTIDGVVEMSRLFRKSRFGVTFEAFDFAIGWIGETEAYLDEDVIDLRIGGTVKYGSIYARGLKSLLDDDYRLDIGFRFDL